MATTNIHRPVTRVYSGCDGKCCCGCSGKYYEADAAQATRIINIINASAPMDLEIGDNYTATVVGTRLYIAYHD